MATVASYPMSSTFAGVYQLQAAGIISDGNTYPAGITDRLVISNGAMMATVSSTDTITAAGHRSEITYSAQTVPGEYWFSFQIMIPSTWNDTYPMAGMQIHDTPDGGDAARAPNFLLEINNGQFIARTPTLILPTESANGLRNLAMPFVKGRWYSMCLHAYWSTTSNGFREFFIDGVRVYQAFNLPTAYVDVVGPYFKCGVYDYFALLVGSQTLYHKNILLSDGNDGYQAMLGTTPKLPTPRISF